MLKKILWLLVLAVVPASAQTAAVQGHSYLGGTQANVSGLKSSNYLNGIIPHATISVYYTGTPTLVPGNLIFSNATGTILGNPFTSNDATSVNPGGYIFWAAVNQAYDIVASGGIFPNTYPTPVTLCTGCYPSTQYVSPGAFTLTTLGTSGPATYLSNVLNIPQYSGGGVTQIIAGNNVTISPTSGIGAVTVNASGSGGSGCGTGSNCVITNPSAGQVITQPASTQLGVNIENGSYYAAQFGASTGIASAIAQACTGIGCDVVAGADYANTEAVPPIVYGSGGYGIGNYLAMPNWPGFTHVRDERSGFVNNIFVAPTGSGSYYAGNTLSQFIKGNWFNSNYDVTIPGNTVVQNTYINQSVFNGPGNQIVGFGGVDLKSYDFGPVVNMVSSDQGQHINGQSNTFCYGVGDCLGPASFITEDGGASTYDDEGAHQGQVQVGEDINVYKGTIATVISGTETKDTVTAGAGTQGNGRYKLDTHSSLVQSGSWPTAYITGTTNAVGQSPPLENFSGATFTPSWAAMVCDPSIDTCNNGLDPTGKINSVAGGYAPGLVTFDIVTSAPSKRSGYATSTSGIASSGTVCVADTQNFETTTYTTISSSQIQISLRKPHYDGMTVAVGGPCQTAVEVTGSTFQYTSGGTKYRQIFPVVGAYSSTQLMIWDHDSQQNYSNAAIGYNSSAYCSTDSNPTVFNVSGSGPYTVTVFENSPNLPDPHFAGQTAIVTTGNSTYNGTVTVSYVTRFFNGLFQHAYSYSLASAPSGTAPTSGTIQFCNTGFNVFPALEVLSVLNPSTNTVDGYFKFAPNSIVGSSAFNVGDTTEEPHYMWQQNSLTGGLDTVDQKTPQAPLSTFPLAGIQYTSYYVGNLPGWSIVNNTDVDRYFPYGPNGSDVNKGTAQAPQAAFYVGGLWKSLFESVDPPAINSSPGGVLKVDNCQPSPYNCNDPLNSPFAIWTGPGGGGDLIYDNTWSQTFDFSQPIQVGALGFPTTLFTPTFGTMAVSTDLSSFVPDGTYEGTYFQFYSSFTPPTNYLHPEMYGDSSTGIGMQFPSADGGTHQTYQGGNLSVGSLQFYVPHTVGDFKTAGFSVSGTVGLISCDDATIGDAGCDLLTKNLQINALPNAARLGTDSSGNVVAITPVADASISVSSFAIPANTCYGSSGSTTPATVTMAGLTTSMGVEGRDTGNPSAINGWGATGGLQLRSWASAPNTASYILCNPTDSSITGGAINFLLVAQ